ncbi:MAG: hypothetical protein Q8K35_00250, partial [Thiobacillus sp.]|nr:hypothetical protein [Thiobacillus sp.]
SLRATRSNPDCTHTRSPVSGMHTSLRPRSKRGAKHDIQISGLRAIWIAAATLRNDNVVTSFV